MRVCEFSLARSGEIQTFTIFWGNGSSDAIELMHLLDLHIIYFCSFSSDFFSLVLNQGTRICSFAFSFSLHSHFGATEKATA